MPVIIRYDTIRALSGLRNWNRLLRESGRPTPLTVHSIYATPSNGCYTYTTNRTYTNRIYTITTSSRLFLHHTRTADQTRPDHSPDTAPQQTTTDHNRPQTTTDHTRPHQTTPQHAMPDLTVSLRTVAHHPVAMPHCRKLAHIAVHEQRVAVDQIESARERVVLRRFWLQGEATRLVQAYRARICALDV